MPPRRGTRASNRTATATAAASATAAAAAAAPASSSPTSTPAERQRDQSSSSLSPPRSPSPPPSQLPAAAPPQPAARSSGLRFNESLAWRVGKAPTVGELLKRLQTLAAELSDLEQDDVDRQALTGPAQDLASQQLIHHKDAGVRAWTACCIADVFRLRAPEAPFTAKQLKDVFTFIITSIFPALADPHNPYNTQHVYVIGTLSQVKCLILLTDLSSANNLIHNLFENCFDILSSTVDDLSKNVEYSMTGILESLVDESQGLPTEVIEIILAQFLRADPRAVALSAANNRGASARKAAASAAAKSAQTDATQSTLQRQLPPAYNLAKNICNTCVDRMARYVSHYFSGVITNASSSATVSRPAANSSKRRTSGDDPDGDDEATKRLTDEGLEQLERAHRLLRELWRAAPGVLQNVIPQVEAELSMESIQLRLLATEAMGDIVSGIGSAGPPKPPVLDPAAYPPLRLDSSDNNSNGRSIRDLTTPSSPQSFAQTHPAAYQSFLSRKNDKSPIIRAAYAVGIGKVLSTAAGGSGLDADAEQTLARNMADMLVDSDEKVRIAAVQAAGLFSYRGFIEKLGALGPVSEDGSFLHNLADRVKDRKHAVSSEAMTLLGKLWGVSVGELAAGNDHVQQLMGPIPSKILDAAYVNDIYVNAMIDQVLFESLVPMGYPTVKKKEKHGSKNLAGPGAAVDEAMAQISEADEDKIRVERILLLIKSLDDRARRVMWSLMARSTAMSNYMNALIKRCEDYNGGVVAKKSEEEEITQHLRKLTDYFAATMPESARVADDLRKFAKAHDRRCYALIRFCMAIDSDYRKVYKSMKELKRRIDALPAGTGTPTMMASLQAVLWRVSNIFYNKSHIAPIMSYSQTDDKGLGGAAQELLKEISARCPRVFKTHSEELCQFLVEHAPAKDRPNDTGTLEALKACATFARSNASDIPKDRKFIQAMMQYALRGAPPASAKYAVTILMSCSDTKAMHAKDLLKQCVKGFEYGSEHFLARLAAMSQLMLLAAPELDEEKDIDPVIDIAINQILLKVRTAEAEAAPESGGDWQPEPDAECSAKTWAMKILVNRLRAFDDPQEIRDAIEPVYRMLDRLIKSRGEVAPEKSTPKPHRARLRLQAALLFLKLCGKRGFEGLLSPQAFNRLATVAQDPLYQVREKFVTTIKKYLGANRLSQRFYTIVFLLAFEPTSKLRDESMIWMRSRAMVLARTKHPTALGVLLARLLSLLAHHPDFDKDDADDLGEFVKYVHFFLRAVATEENLSLLYHAAQRVKTVQDGIDAKASDKLYCMSDLAQAVIRRYEESQGWSMQAYSGKIDLPAGIFAAIKDQSSAHAIASKQYIPEALLDRIDTLVKERSRPSKKRKSQFDADRSAKRRVAGTSSGANGLPHDGNAAAASTSNGVNHKTLAVRKAKARGSGSAGKSTSQSKKGSKKSAARARRGAGASDDDDDDAGDGAAGSGERRRSGRHVNGRPKNYAESDEDEAAAADEENQGDDDDEDEADEDEDGEEEGGGEPDEDEDEAMSDA